MISWRSLFTAWYADDGTSGCGGADERAVDDGAVVAGIGEKRGLGQRHSQKKREMMIEAICDSCGGWLQTSFENAGKSLKCPVCRQTVTVPARPHRLPGTPEPVNLTTSSPANDVTSDSKPSRFRSKKTLGVLIGAAAVTVASLLLVFGLIDPSINSVQEQELVDRKQTGTQGLAFDRFDFQRTKRWTESLPVRIPNIKNAVALERGLEFLAQDLTTLSQKESGQPVRWAIPVKDVSRGLELESRYWVFLRGVDSGIRVELHFLPGESALRWVSYRQLSRKQITEEHIAELKTGDAVTVTGKLKEIRFDGHSIEIVLSHCKAER